MRDLVQYLASALVDNPAPVEVSVTTSANEAVFRLKVDADDLGKIIGKKGRTAKALRTLLAAVGAKQNTRVNLEILEPAPAAGADGLSGSEAPRSAVAGDDA